jgi:hypothetical protein
MCRLARDAVDRTNLGPCRSCGLPVQQYLPLQRSDTRGEIMNGSCAVLQPHVSQSRYRTLCNGGAGEDRVRLRRLETLLNAARGAVVGVGAEFVVVSEA